MFLRVSPCRLFYRFVFALILVASTHAEAKIFRNAYVSFVLPDSWKCLLEHTEWVCKSESDKESKEAIIVLTAKETGPTDSFDAYAQHLGSALTPSSGPAQGIPSKVQAAPKQIAINNHTWVDGLHLHGEVANYFTRYLATIKDKIAILVTYSAHKDHYAKYSTDFFSSVQSLQVIATKNLMNDPSLGPINKADGDIIGGSNIEGHMAGLGDTNLPPPPKSGASGNTRTLMIALAGLLLAAAAYILLKMKKR